MNIRLIALDLDGTLMSSDHLTVSERNKAALLKAHENGVKIAISTGRTLSVVERVIKQIPFIDYVMYSDGASVYDVKNRKIIYKKLIPFEITREIIEYLNTTEVYYNIYLDGQIATQKGRQRYYNNTDLPTDFVNDYVRNTNIYEDLLSEINGKSVELIVGFFNTQEEYLASRKFIDRFSDRLYITSAFRNEFEMTDINATKGKTMDYLCKIDNIESSQVIAFGDSGNDLPLLEFAGISVAMGNAEDKVKQIADFITETNALDGVAVAVEKFVLNI